MGEDIHVFSSTIGLSDVNIKLPHELKAGKWQIGLSEISYFKSRTQFPNFDIYCDIIVPNIKNGKSSQILRRAYTEKNDVTIRYNPIFYCDVMRPALDGMTLYLKVDGKVDDSFKEILVNCTLHLRRIRND